eukprot:769474-Pleurochrysis_carterae.AAC.1
MKKIINALKDRFTSADAAQWDSFFDDYPKSVDDIPVEDIKLLTDNWLPPCSMRMPDESGRLQQQ